MPDDPTKGSATPDMPVAPGLYDFTDMAGDVPTRFHLRVDPDGGGLLMANSAEAAHLSPVGVMMVHGVLHDLDDKAIAAEVRASFSGGSDAEVADDLFQVRQLLFDLASPDDNYPITNFGGADMLAHSRQLAAPFRADVVQGDLGNCEEMLRELWSIGIPHVTFLAQPGADMSQLGRLVECAEDLGMITGLRGVASWFTEQDLHDAAFAGLDYLALVVASSDAAEHDTMVGAPGDHERALRTFEMCREWELCPVAQIPLTDQSADELEDIVEWATSHGVGNLWFFAITCLDGEEQADAAGALPARALPQVATLVTEAAEESNARFIWQTPVKFDLRNTLSDHVTAGPRASGDIAIRVEPDGSVYPARGKRTCNGNILTDEWKDIWASDCFRLFREKVEAHERCGDCPGLAICDAACPKDPSTWSDDTEDGEAE